MALKSLKEINQEFIRERFLAVNAKTFDPNAAIKLAPFETGFQKADDLPKRDAVSTEIIAAYKELPEHKAENKKRSKASVISGILFYAAVLLILLSALIPGSNGSPKTIMGYSYFTVLTSSMQDEIPKDSLILVKEVDPQKLKAGDNITYMRDPKTSVTHKIMSIYENYQGSGNRGFQTKGVNNQNPDKDIVNESKVVGKVVLVPD